MKPIRSAPAWALVSIVLSGCFFARAPETKYYMLDYQPAPSKERLQRGPYPFVARLREPTIAEAYRRNQIVYRQSAYQMQFYAYHLWSVDPDRMLGDLLLKHLRAARLFTNITRSAESYTPDFHLTCDIQAIEEYDAPETWYARLAVEYQLIEEKSGDVVWKKLFDLRKSVSQQEPVYVVRELSALAETIHERLVEELEVALDEAKYRASTQAEVPAKP